MIKHTTEHNHSDMHIMWCTWYHVCWLFLDHKRLVGLLSIFNNLQCICTYRQHSNCIQNIAWMQRAISKSTGYAVLKQYNIRTHSMIDQPTHQSNGWLADLWIKWGSVSWLLNWLIDFIDWLILKSFISFLDVSILEEVWKGWERAQKESWKGSYGTEKNGWWTQRGVHFSYQACKVAQSVGKRLLRTFTPNFSFKETTWIILWTLKIMILQ